MATVQLPTIQVRQHGRTMYLLSIEAKDLLEFTDVDIWNPELSDEGTKDYIEAQGYQREPMPRHFSRVSTYVSKADSILPTTVLLSSRKKLNFVREKPDGNAGKLILTEDDLPLWVVDGQHRLRGIQYAIEEKGKAELRDFPLTVCVMDNIEKYEEIIQFQIVNTTARRLRTDLADRLLLLMSQVNRGDLDIPVSDLWRLQATEITILMNEQEDSPWEGRIRAPNTSSGNTIISERSFSTSLKPILLDGTMGNYPSEELVGWLTAFWETVAELMPEAFENPSDYAVQKTPGVYTFHMIVPKVFGLWLVGGQRDKIRKILTANSAISEYFTNSDYWRSGSGEGAGTTGMGGFSRLANDIAEVLPEAQMPNIGSMR